MVGIVASEPVVIAIWAALGPPPGVSANHVIAAISVAAAYAITVRLPTSQARMPRLWSQ